MNPNSMEASNNHRTKEESTSRASSSSNVNNPTPWLKSKDPRIVRVSRALGTKDRHSKVCTVRGLRDRRVRLSVPTAIQLYDLQDRLGLNQPSKVFDWLIDASKEAIDDLPPLQMPQGLHHPINNPSNEIDWEDQTGLARLNLWNSSNLSRSRSKEVVEEEEKQDDGHHHHQVSSSTNFFPRNNNNNNSSSSLQGLLNSMLPYGGSYYQLEPSSNFNFSQLGGHHHGIMTSSSSSSHHHHGHGDHHHHQQELQNFNVLVCPPQAGTTSTTTQPYFPEFDPRQISHFHMLSSATNPFTTFQLGMNPNNHTDDARNKILNKDP